MRVLIAEDDSVTFLSLKDILERMGHIVVAPARDGSEAVQLVEDEEPDLIIMDIRMPGVDGIEAARTIMRERPTPIIIVTAYSDESLIERASKVGISTYLVKPVREDDLRPALKLAVDRFHEQQALTSEISQMRESLETRRLVDKAKWILVEQLGVSERQAYQRIQQLSRDRNIKMGEIARVIISGRTTSPA